MTDFSGDRGAAFCVRCLGVLFLLTPLLSAQNPDELLAVRLPATQGYINRHATPLPFPPDFTVTFTEDKNGFYINGRKFAADAPPMTSARVGTYQHWRILNQTAELHPFHIHQVHFLAYAENGVPLVHPVWLDTVNVPYGSSVDVILDFTDPSSKACRYFIVIY